MSGWSVNLRGSFTLHATQCSLHFYKSQKNEIHSLSTFSLKISTNIYFRLKCNLPSLVDINLHSVGDFIHVLVQLVYQSHKVNVDPDM